MDSARLFLCEKAVRDRPLMVCCVRACLRRTSSFRLSLAKSVVLVLSVPLSL